MNNFLLTRANVLQALKRFPETFLCCLLFCVAALWPGQLYPGVYLQPIFLASVVFTTSRLFFEGVPFRARIMRAAVPLIMIAIMVVTLEVATNIDVRLSSFILLAIAMIALVPIAPFIARAASRDKIYTFGFRLARQIFLALVVSAIILVGLMAISFSIRVLFNVIKADIILDITAIIGSLLFSVVTLSGMPHDFESDEQVFGVNLVHALLGYLVIPMLMFYGGILCWYVVSLAITQALPKGVIVYLAAGFGTMGIAVRLLLDHSKISRMVTIALFQKYFFKFLLVPLFLMGWAIGIRVSEYGLSGPRFIVVMTLLWISMVTIYSFANRAQHLSKFVYLSAASVAFITALGLSGFTGLLWPVQDNNNLQKIGGRCMIAE